MYIYKICEFREVDFYQLTGYSYLMYENNITNDEFSDMCKEGLSVIEEQSLPSLKEWLIKHKGFRLLNIKGQFEFEGKY